MFMKTFEENWTAWVDGELSDAERAEFEASLTIGSRPKRKKIRRINSAHCLGNNSSRARWGMRNFSIINCAVALRRK